MVYHKKETPAATSAWAVEFDSGSYLLSVFGAVAADLAIVRFDGLPSARMLAEIKGLGAKYVGLFDHAWVVRRSAIGATRLSALLAQEPTREVLRTGAAPEEDGGLGLDDLIALASAPAEAEAEAPAPAKAQRKSA